MVVPPPLEGAEGPPTATGPRVPRLRTGPAREAAPRGVPHAPIPARVEVGVLPDAAVATDGPVLLVGAVPTAGRNGAVAPPPRGVPGATEPHTVDATKEEVPIFLAPTAAAAKPLPPPLQGAGEAEAPLLVGGGATQGAEPLVQPRAVQVTLLGKGVVAGPVAPVAAPVPPPGVRVAASIPRLVGVPALQGAVAGGRVKPKGFTGPSVPRLPNTVPGPREVGLEAAPTEAAATGAPKGNGRPLVPPPKADGAAGAATRDGCPRGHPNPSTNLNAFDESYSSGTGGYRATNN